MHTHICISIHIVYKTYTHSFCQIYLHMNTHTHTHTPKSMHIHELGRSIFDELSANFERNHECISELDELKDEINK